MSNILLVEPYAFLSERYSENENYAIYSEKSVSYWVEGSRLSIGLNYPETIPRDIDLEEIKSKINWSMPLWSRWMGQADRYEDYRQTCLMFIVHCVQALSELDVRSVVFFTGVAHHIEYSLIEVACQMAGARQIYLYPMPFFTAQSRLLPLMQNDSIHDRHILGVEVSDKGVRDEVIAYRNNSRLSRPPQLNEKIDRVARSYLYAMMQLAIYSLKAVARAILWRNRGVVRHPIDERRDYDCLSILRLIRHQKTALDYYLSETLDELTIDRMVETEGPLPIIYAHYQPEASTFPEGGNYANHLDVVIALRRFGYRGKILYKEHPGSLIYYSRITGFSRVGLCRSVEYYRQLAALGCVFVPTSFQLRESDLQKLFPVTITGSVGLERSMAGLATCCAGLPWFKGAPGVHNLSTTFGEKGVFYDRMRWQFDPTQGVAWFDQALSRRTISNYPGIGTGAGLGNTAERVVFLEEFDALLKQITESEMIA